MSSSRKKRLGGCTENLSHNSSRPTTSKSEKPTKATPEETTTEYKGKLRPRPTRQTERFSTPVTVKKDGIIKPRSLSKEGNTEGRPSTSKAVKREYSERVITDPVSSPKAKSSKSNRAASSGRPSTAHKDKDTVSEALPKKAHQSASAVGQKKAPQSKSLAKKNIVVVTGTSHPLTQSQLTSCKPSSKKQTDRAPLKGATTRKHIVVKSETSDSALPYQKPGKGVRSRLGKERPSPKTKTGSCGSTRRGSVRSQTSGVNRVSQSGRLPSEPVRSNASNTTSMRKSKHSSEESGSRKRAANDTDGKASTRESNEGKSEMCQSLMP